MAKATQADIKTKIEEYASLSGKISKAQTAKNAELQPFVEKHNEEIAPIVSKHDAKIHKLVDQRTAIETEVLGWLEQHGKPITLESESAVAVNEVQVGKRSVAPQTFLEKAKDKGAAAWDCVTVAIGKAEKLLGKTLVDEISTKESKLVSSLKLKS